MPLSRNEAADTLRDIGRTEQRSSHAYGYERAAPFLILWGVIWFVAYGATDLIPQVSQWAWPVLAIVGMAISFWMGVRQQTSGASKYAWRWLALMAAITAFITATFLVLKPVNGMQIGAFVPLIVALIYIVAGLWLGFRMLVTGVAIGALTLVGYLYVPQHFGLWMAVVGGGALVLGGVWLRRA